MINGKYIVLASNVYDDEGIIVPSFYLGERPIDLTVGSHDVFAFDTVEKAKANSIRSNFVSNFRDAKFTIQKVTVEDVETV